MSRPHPRYRRRIGMLPLFFILLLLTLLLRPAPGRAGAQYDPLAQVCDLFTPQRLQLAAEYDRIHYGLDSSELREPKLIVLHFTAFSTLKASLDFFRPALLDVGMRRDIASGGRVNVSTHYLVDLDGAVWQLAAENVVCRHTIGFNHTSISIENVGSGAEQLTEAQARSDAALISRIVARHPSIQYLIGHQEYRDGSRPHYTLFRELDHSYRFTHKVDPGSRFLARVRGLLKEQYGITLKD